jgi:hypothetical protein
LEANYQTNKSQNKPTNSSISNNKTDTANTNANDSETITPQQASNESNSCPSILEKLILYPSESHQISNLDLYESNNCNNSSYAASNAIAHDDVQHQSDLKNNVKDNKNSRTIVTNELTKTIEVYFNNNVNPSNNTGENQNVDVSNFNPLSNSEEVSKEESTENPTKFQFNTEEDPLRSLDKKPMNYDENLMMIDDDCAILPDDFSNNNNNKKLPLNENAISSSSTQMQGTTKNNSKTSLSSSLKSCFKINVEQLKAGLTTNTSKITSNLSNKETKDLTLIQLYLALNKPNIIRLKYDWILTHSNPSTSFASKQVSSAPNLADEAGSQTSLLTLHSSQNQQQRFYIETLANVGASFLNELLAKNNSNSNTNSNANLFVIPTALPHNNGAANSNLPSNGISKAANASSVSFIHLKINFYSMF